MGKTYRNNCLNCGEYYEGRGKFFCKTKCVTEWKDKFGNLQNLEEIELGKFDPESFRKAEIQRTKDDLIKNAERKELSLFRKGQAISELVAEQIKAEIYRLPKLKPPRKHRIKKPSDKAIEIMALVSDCQIGEKVTRKDVGGLNEYNFEIFKIELQIWKNEVIRFIDTQLLTQQVQKIVIPFIGDIVQGHDIFKGQAYHLDLHVIHQLVQGAMEFAKVLGEISETFPQLSINVPGVMGNHGRIGRKGDAPTSCNFDYLFYLFLEEKLHNFKVENGGNMKFQWSDAWFQLWDSCGWIFCFLHGDDVGRWMGLPYYGVDRAKAKYMEMLNQYFTYFVMGHHHTEAILPSDNGEKIINGNWVGGNSGSKMWMGSNNPNQWIFTINRKYGILLREKIYLKTRHDTKPKIKIYS